jgi:hypothetical protein
VSIFFYSETTEGKPQYVAALQEDITERKRLEAELVTAKEIAEAPPRPNLISWPTPATRSARPNECDSGHDPSGAEDGPDA